MYYEYENLEILPLRFLFNLENIPMRCLWAYLSQNMSGQYFLHLLLSSRVFLLQKNKLQLNNSIRT